MCKSSVRERGMNHCAGNTICYSLSSQSQINTSIPFIPKINSILTQRKIPQNSYPVMESGMNFFQGLMVTFRLFLGSGFGSSWSGHPLTKKFPVHTDKGYSLPLGRRKNGSHVAIIGTYQFWNPIGQTREGSLPRAWGMFLEWVCFWTLEEAPLFPMALDFSLWEILPSWWFSLDTSEKIVEHIPSLETQQLS